MKNIVAFLLLLLPFSEAYSQNPASAIKDHSLSMPEKSFEVFWQTFEDNYAFFKLRGIDWKSSYKKFRPQVTPATSDDDLFSILSKMVAPFHDDHVNIIIPGQRQFTAEKPSHFLKEFPDKSNRDSLCQAINLTLYSYGFDSLRSIGPEFKGKKLFYYTQSADYGYIRMERCFVSVETEDDNKLDSTLAGNFLDSIIQSMGTSKAIILDLRSNIGGNDEFAYAVAGRFVAQKTLGHSKQTRISGTHKFTTLEKWHIIPRTNQAYTKPVVLLTNDQTASAGDVMAMIFKARPQATLIGDNTTGIYSDMYGFELPNKWLISLSNQKYYSSKMVCYEGTGTPVDIPVKNNKQDVKSMKDPVVSKAINFLTN